VKTKLRFITFFGICVMIFTTCDFLNGDEEKGKDTVLVTVEPLIKTTWGLGAPYNNLAPMDSGSRSAAGCNAITVAQIMKFYRHPAKGNGQSEAYTAEKLGIEIPSVVFNVNYDYDNILNNYANADSGTEQ
jgi:hypothetical protein